MFNVGGGEVLVILVLALVVLGPDKLPEAARTLGKHIGDFRRISGGFRDEITNAMSLSSSAPASATEPAPVVASAPIPGPDPAAADPAAEGSPPSSVHTEGPVESFA